MIEVALTLRFADFALDVAFTAPAGVTALFGRSGSGKTTVVNAVAGLLRPDAGRVAVAGEVLVDTARGVWVPPHRRRIGYVFQEGRLFPHLSVRQNLTYGRRFAPAAARADLAPVVEMLGIGALLDRRPGTLSGGERARVGIGRALLSAPRLLILDEPLAALDDARRAEIMPYLERLRDEAGVPMLYISHAMTEVARLATTLVRIEAGRVVAAGPLADLSADPALAAREGAEAGAVLPGRIAGREPDGLMRIATPAGPFLVPDDGTGEGRAVQLRIRASDVMLSRWRPVDSSALNILPATVVELRPDGVASALIRLELAGRTALLARVTQRSVAALGLAPGAACHATVKSVALG